MKNILLFAISAILALGAMVPAFGDDPSADEIITRHLNSIAPPEARGKVKTLLAAGLSSFEAKNPATKGGGKAVVVSDPDNLYFLMSLSSSNYQYEKIGAFGSKVALPYTMSGNQRSLLGAFLNEHNKVLTSNLFCGSMSLRWIDNLTSNKNLTFKVAGKKKINGHQAYVLDAIIKGYGTSDFSVRLFFDAENFHHVRTEYRREVTTGNVTMGVQNNQESSRLNLTEEFDEFVEKDGLTLPHLYKVTFASNAINTETSWSINIVNYYPNQQLAPGFFTFDEQK